MSLGSPTSSISGLIIRIKDGGTAGRCNSFPSDDDPHRTINAFSIHFCNRVRAARRSSFSMAAVCSFVAYADAALHHGNGGLLYLCGSDLAGNYRYVCHLQLTQIAFKGISTQWHVRKVVRQRTATPPCHENSTETSAPLITRCRGTAGFVRAFMLLVLTTIGEAEF